MFTFIQKYIIAGMGVAIAVLIMATGWYYIKAGVLENEVTALAEDVRKVTDANVAFQSTVSSLKQERTKANKVCESRLQGYDETLAELVRIESLNGGQNAQENENAVGGVRRGSGDVLLDSLNGVFPGPSGGQNGICEADHSGDAKGADVLSGQVRHYCFCGDRDVKNWLKNRVLDQGWMKQFETILEGLR